MKKKFEKQIASLGLITDFVSEFATAADIDEAALFQMNLVIEEMFTNMVKYNTESAHDVEIAFQRDADRLIIELRDFGVESFDITQTEPVDTSLPVEQRTPGGLGIHLVKQFMDEIKYEYKDGNSKITLVKNLES